MSRYAIIFGGESYEHEISIVSAITIKDVLKSDLVFIFCDDKHTFYLINEKDMKAKYFSSMGYKKSEELSLRKGGFYKKALLKEKIVEFDIAINLIHGKDGEDGALSSLLDFYDIPYIGPRVEGCCISYDKHFTKLYAKSKNVDILPYKILNKSSDRVIDMDYPIIVKPLRLGSSIGLSVVKDEKDLDYSLDVAFEFDDDVLIEPYYENIKEYNLAGIKSKNGYIFSMIEEPKKSGILDFDKKYLDFSRSEGASKAVLSEEMKEKIYSSFKSIYGDLFNGAIIRCDFFIKDDTVYLNEINPVPGSLANYLFEDFNSIIDEISKNLPKKRKISVDYRYINSINAAKGK